MTIHVTRIRLNRECRKLSFPRKLIHDHHVDAVVTQYQAELVLAEPGEREHCKGQWCIEVKGVVQDDKGLLFVQAAG